MEIPPDDARVLVGPRAQYYLTRWEGIDQGRAPILGFNWAAFFGTGLWLLHRRMYRMFWMLIGALLASMVVLQLLFPDLPRAVSSGVDLLVAATLGTFGSYWYYLHTLRQWRIASSSGPDAMARRGGTRWWPVVVAIVAFGVLLYLASAESPV